MDRLDHNRVGSKIIASIVRLWEAAFEAGVMSDLDCGFVLVRYTTVVSEPPWIARCRVTVPW
jgi:hypothetical protein